MRNGAGFSFPDTLIISEAPFSFGHGFGVTLSTFFHGWPADHLRLFFTRRAAVVGEHIGGRMTFADVPGHWGRRYGVECLLGRRPTWRGRYSPLWLRSALDRWRPEVVYAFVFSGETLAFASWVAGRVRSPLVVHVADDGLETSKAGVTREIRSLLGDATRLLSISQEMRVEYLSRYGLESDVLHNGASEESYEPAPAADYRNGTFVVRYLGSVVPDHHYHAIEDVVAAVRELAASGLAVRFELCGGTWTRQHAEPFSDGRTVVYRGDVSRPEGFELLRSADLLVVPVSFSPASRAQVRLSLPTKLPEYLASGTPTLVYGPNGSAPVDFCRRHGVGTVIDERSVAALTACVRAFAADRTASRRHAAPAREFIRTHYSAPIVRQQFRAILAGAINGASS